MKPDIEIARAARLEPITRIAEQLGLAPGEIEPYGSLKAKVRIEALARRQSAPDGKLVLVSAISPTPAGEGKTTTTVGVGMALHKLGVRTLIALREPSLGPCFGMKGGAAGGGYAQVVPMEDINLHFTGDFHAVTTAHNLLAAMLDNHLQQGNALRIDPRTAVFRRVLDMNDRALRNIVVGLGGKGDGVPRESGFDITTASEVMAILCLASDARDLKERLGRIIVAYDVEARPVTALDLKAHGAMAVLLKDAIHPNLVQTLENTPALIHGGPFANIAHGCNTVIATRLALKLADVVVTEAGFGFDLGGEKFLDIKCRAAGLWPHAMVLVATVRALKMHGGVAKAELGSENLAALELGLSNLDKHIENAQSFGLPVVVALNRFASDSDAELGAVEAACDKRGVRVALSEVFARGGDGGIAVAEELRRMLSEPAPKPRFSYPLEMPIAEKIETVARSIYGAEGADFAPPARRMLERISKLGYGGLPVCIAKTQYSFTDQANLIGRPRGFRITINEVRLSAGAGFVVAIAGDIMTMPGLPRVPAAEHMDIDENGVVSGLF